MKFQTLILFFLLIATVAHAQKERSKVGIKSYSPNKAHELIGDDRVANMKLGIRNSDDVLKVDDHPALNIGLEQAFKNPPYSAKPATWMHWVNGHISKDGIARDFKAIADAGLGACIVFDIASGGIHGSVNFGTPEYYDAIRFAGDEAKRLGLEFGIHNCDGWSSSGGPWVTPEHSMKEVVSSELLVEASKSGQSSIKLPSLPEKEGWSKTIAVYAWPKSLTDKAKELKPYSPVSNSLEFANNPDFGSLKSEDIINLTDKLNGDMLNWTPPEGSWKIVRVGTTITGAKNAPARAGGKGLEVDKLSTESFDLFWDGYMEKVIKKMGKLNGNAFKYVEIDSFEKGPQNWTSNMLQEFKSRRGYDASIWLPVLVGYIVNGKAESARFLADYYRTISELLAQNYDGRMQERLDEHDLSLITEGYHAFANNLDRMKYSDIPMGEFWMNEHFEQEKHWGWPDRVISTCKLAASSAHIQGNRIVGAEAFTARGTEGGWRGHPYAWKGLGDFAFVEGVNWIVFHRYAHQPYRNIVPGMTMGFWGSHFDVGNSLWPMLGSSYFEYLWRCQAMLQLGDFVADLAYYVGDHVPVRQLDLNDYVKRPPAGYDYDLINSGVLQGAHINSDGCLQLSSGMRYRALILPKSANVMLPETLACLEKLVKNGLRIYGPKPEISPTLIGWPESEQKLRALADKMWPKNGISKQYGKGWVFADGSIQEIVGVIPDVSIPDELDKQMGYIHRRILEGGKEMDLYFVAKHNGDKPQQLDLVFRNRGKVPEIWHPTKKKIIEDVPYTRTPEGWCKLMLEFVPYESYFVVFTEDETSVAPAKSKSISSTKERMIKVLDSPWIVQFLPNHITGKNWGPEKPLVMNSLKSLHLHADEAVKYFSGQVEYSTKFNFDQKTSQLNYIYIDLGDSKEISEVRLNGKLVETLWMKPLQVEISDYLKDGENNLEITVSTRLINRLIGDELYPEDLDYNKFEHPHSGNIFNFHSQNGIPQWMQEGSERPNSKRKTFSYVKFHHKDSPLVPSGLLGPVRIIERN